MVYSLLVYLTSFLMRTVWICNATHWGRFPLRHFLTRCAQNETTPLRHFASLKHSPEAGGQADVGEGGRVREHRPYLRFAVTGYAAAYWGYQELVLGMLPGKGYEAVYCEFEAVQAFHRGDGVRSTLQALAHAPLRPEVLQGESGSSAGVHSLGVAAKDEDLTGV